MIFLKYISNLFEIEGGQRRKNPADVAAMGVTTWWPGYLGKSAPIDPAAHRHHHPGPTAYRLR